MSHRIPSSNISLSDSTRRCLKTSCPMNVPSCATQVWDFRGTWSWRWSRATATTWYTPTTAQTARGPTRRATSRRTETTAETTGEEQGTRVAFLTHYHCDVEKCKKNKKKQNCLLLCNSFGQIQTCRKTLKKANASDSEEKAVVWLSGPPLRGAAVSRQASLSPPHISSSCGIKLQRN